MPFPLPVRAFPLPAPPASPPLAGWAGTLARPGSGLGFLAAALSAQPLATLLALVAAVLAALLLPRA